MLNKIPKHVGVVILAAGKGTRLGCNEMPKVMLEIGGRPIVSYIVETLFAIGFIKSQICLVVGFKKESVQKYFGDKVLYAEQTELLGTAHAAFTGMTALPKNLKQILIIDGDDSAFYKVESLASLIRTHINTKATVSLFTAEPENYQQMGRVVRGRQGKVEVIEKEYLTDEQKSIKEVSTGTFVFDRAWFENIFPAMPRMRKINEFGLPTALSMAGKQGLKVNVVPLKDNGEWFGINNEGELKTADERKRIVLSS